MNAVAEYALVNWRFRGRNGSHKFAQRRPLDCHFPFHTENSDKNVTFLFFSPMCQESHFPLTFLLSLSLSLSLSLLPPSGYEQNRLKNLREMMETWADNELRHTIRMVCLSSLSAHFPTISRWAQILRQVTANSGRAFPSVQFQSAYCFFNTQTLAHMLNVLASVSGRVERDHKRHTYQQSHTFTTDTHVHTHIFDNITTTHTHTSAATATQ